MGENFLTKSVLTKQASIKVRQFFSSMILFLMQVYKNEEYSSRTPLSNYSLSSDFIQEPNPKQYF